MRLCLLAVWWCLRTISKPLQQLWSILWAGRIVVYESLLDRGRREALLRMKEQATAWGATQVINVRLETSNIGRSASGNSNMVAIEVMAYGTGIR